MIKLCLQDICGRVVDWCYMVDHLGVFLVLVTPRSRANSTGRASSTRVPCVAPQLCWGISCSRHCTCSVVQRDASMFRGDSSAWLSSNVNGLRGCIHGASANKASVPQTTQSVLHGDCASCLNGLGDCNHCASVSVLHGGSCISVALHTPASNFQSTSPSNGDRRRILSSSSSDTPCMALSCCLQVNKLHFIYRHNNHVFSAHNSISPKITCHKKATVIMKITCRQKSTVMHCPPKITCHKKATGMHSRPKIICRQNMTGNSLKRNNNATVRKLWPPHLPTRHKENNINK